MVKLKYWEIYYKKLCQKAKHTNSESFQCQKQYKE